MSDPASERPAAPDVTTALLFNNWAVLDDHGRLIFFGLREGPLEDGEFAATWLELAFIDEEVGWARGVDGRLIRLGTRMPKATDPGPTFEERFGPDFKERFAAAVAEARRLDPR